VSKGSLPKYDDARIARLWSAQPRPSIREIAEQVGCAPRTVQRSLRRSEVPPEPCGAPYTDDELALARRLLEDGVPYSEVARTIGRNAERLAERLPGYGIHDPGERLAIARMFRDFERLLERRGLSDIASTTR
jgi:hypothetical protein